jgi:hypothetical protein
MIPKMLSATAPEPAPRKTGTATLLKRFVSGRTAATACCAIACLIGVAGCAGGKAEVEEVVLAFVEGIKNQDSARLETIVNWERYYSYRNDEASTEIKVSPEDVETQKTLLLRVFAGDRGLTIRYRTAENTIKNVSVDGNEASAEVLQIDRASGEKRLITFLLAKSGVWKIYHFSTEELGSD